MQSASARQGGGLSWRSGRRVSDGAGAQVMRSARKGRLSGSQTVHSSSKNTAFPCCAARGADAAVALRTARGRLGGGRRAESRPTGLGGVRRGPTGKTARRSGLGGSETVPFVSTTPPLPCCAAAGAVSCGPALPGGDSDCAGGRAEAVAIEPDRGGQVGLPGGWRWR